MVVSLSISNKELIEKAKKVAKIKQLSMFCKAGEVGCAIITIKGNIYLGSSIDAPSGIGFCAEHSAIANMIANNESEIERIVAICEDGTILPPCGRCREFVYLINYKNLETEIILSEKHNKKLKELLPERWQEQFKS